MTQPSSEDRGVEMALFRYTLILPLQRGEFPPGGKGRLRQQIADRQHLIPYSSRCTISASTLARWERRYIEQGFDGLKPQPRRDRGQPRAISVATLDRAETLKREQPRRSSRSIIRILSLDHTNPVPEERLAPRTLRRHLALRGATSDRLLNEQRPKPYRRFERSHFGDLWQGDAMDGPWLPDPADPERQRQTFLFAFLDDHTRFVPHAQFYWSEQLPRLEDCFKRALLRYGRPLAIYVDQGKVYTSKQLNTICATLGIQRILGTPYYPEGRGKIERFFQFVQSDFLPELPSSSVATLPALNESLLAWIEVVYHRKLHSETGQAPLERRRQDPTPSIRPVDPEELRTAFLHRDQRKVTKTATFSFRNNRYRVAAFLRGQRVELRYDPFDLTHIEVWLHRAGSHGTAQDTFLQEAEPDRVVTTIHPDVTPDPVPAPPPGSGLDYLALLRAERERLLQQQLDGIHFTQLPASTTQSQETENDDHAR
ncbi:MAG: DDE-type integrase/transposase/recombinase [Ardenticatenales bacterium]|nr:DDE-type integrase/transposase/recombinase [Ardenticatenales bacterium]